MSGVGTHATTKNGFKANPSAPPPLKRIRRAVYQQKATTMIHDAVLENGGKLFIPSDGKSKHFDQIKTLTWLRDNGFKQFNSMDDLNEIIEQLPLSAFQHPNELNYDILCGMVNAKSQDINHSDTIDHISLHFPHLVTQRLKLAETDTGRLTEIEEVATSIECDIAHIELAEHLKELAIAALRKQFDLLAKNIATIIISPDDAAQFITIADQLNIELSMFATTKPLRVLIERINLHDYSTPIAYSPGASPTLSPYEDEEPTIIISSEVTANDIATSFSTYQTVTETGKVIIDTDKLRAVATKLNFNHNVISMLINNEHKENLTREYYDSLNEIIQSLYADDSGKKVDIILFLIPHFDHKLTSLLENIGNQTNKLFGTNETEIGQALRMTISTYNRLIENALKVEQSDRKSQIFYKIGEHFDTMILNRLSTTHPFMQDDAIVLALFKILKVLIENNGGYFFPSNLDVRRALTEKGRALYENEEAAITTESKPVELTSLEPQPTVYPSDLYYEDHDINTILDTVLNGTSRNILLEDGEHGKKRTTSYLLRNDDPTSEKYIAVVPAVNMITMSTLSNTPISFYLDKSSRRTEGPQDKEELAAYLQQLENEDKHRKFNKIDACNKCCTEYKKTSGKHNKTIPTECAITTEESAEWEEHKKTIDDYDLDKQFEKRQEVGFRKVDLDIFDDLANSGVINKANFDLMALMPLSINQGHWVTIAINLEKRENHFGMSIDIYDSYGSTSLSPESFNALATATEKRLANIYPGAEVKTGDPTPHPLGIQTDLISCGAHTSEVLLMLLRGEKPETLPKIDGTSLRKMHLNLVAESGIERRNKQLFINRNRKRLELMRVTDLPSEADIKEIIERTSPPERSTPSSTPSTPMRDSIETKIDVKICAGAGAGTATP